MSTTQPHGRRHDRLSRADLDRAAMNVDPKLREAWARKERAMARRLRGEARRQGMRLVKSRCRNQQAVEYGTYTLIWNGDGSVVEELMSVMDVVLMLRENLETNGELVAGCRMLSSFQP